MNALTAGKNARWQRKGGRVEGRDGEKEEIKERGKEEGSEEKNEGREGGMDRRTDGLMESPMDIERFHLLGQLLSKFFGKKKAFT